MPRGELLQLHEPRQSEVDQAWPSTLIDDHIAGLHIPVDNTVVVGVLKRICQLRDERHGHARLRQARLPRNVDPRPQCLEEVAKGLPFDVLHPEVEKPAFIPEAEHGHDSRMDETLGRRGLPAEALAPARARRRDRGRGSSRRRVVRRVVAPPDARRPGPPVRSPRGARVRRGACLRRPRCRCRAAPEGAQPSVDGTESSPLYPRPSSERSQACAADQWPSKVERGIPSRAASSGAGTSAKMCNSKARAMTGSRISSRRSASCSTSRFESHSAPERARRTGAAGWSLRASPALSLSSSTSTERTTPAAMAEKCMRLRQGAGRPPAHTSQVSRTRRAGRNASDELVPPSTARPLLLNSARIRPRRTAPARGSRRPMRSSRWDRPFGRPSPALEDCDPPGSRGDPERASLASFPCVQFMLHGKETRGEEGHCHESGLSPALGGPLPPDFLRDLAPLPRLGTRSGTRGRLAPGDARPTRGQEQVGRARNRSPNTRPGTGRGNRPTVGCYQGCSRKAASGSRIAARRILIGPAGSN